MILKDTPISFFGTVGLFKFLIFHFFAIIFSVSEGPSSFFDILQKKGCLISSKDPLSHFWQYETVQNSHILSNVS